MTIARRNTWLPDVFNELFDSNFMPRTISNVPAINVKESDKAYTVELAAPGMKKEDFNVNIDDEGNLKVRMESKSEKKEEDNDGHYLRREFSYSTFERTLILPEDVDKDKIAATVADGVLTISLPKVEKAEVKTSRQIIVG